MTANLPDTTPAQTTQSLRVSDPRQYGPTRGSPPLTKLARALYANPTRQTLNKLTALLEEHLANGDEDVLQNALAACPDTHSYELLYGFTARQACQWMSIDGHGDTDTCWLFGIPLTLHTNDWAGAENWHGSAWGPENSTSDLRELSDILRRTGATAGIRDLAVLPHLVMPSPLRQLGFCESRQMAAALVHRPQSLQGESRLEHRPWQEGAGAQYRVLVLAGRSGGMPTGLLEEIESCNHALMAWAKRCFQVPHEMTAVASSPELLLSLVTGKGEHMGNCARLAALLTAPLAVTGSPCLSVEAAPAGPCEGTLVFRSGQMTSEWRLHGRKHWVDELQTLGQMLPRVAGRYARMQLGLPSA